MNVLLRRLIITLIAKPFARGLIGLDVHNAQHLPKKGPAIIAANHNSYLDTLFMVCLFPGGVSRYVRPVAAADHFLTTKLMRWLSHNIGGVVPINRRGAKAREDVLAGCKEALANGDILLLFPEGTRGKAEEMGNFKTGIARLAEQFPDVPIVPVYLQGTGRVWPRGSRLIVPFNCSAIIGAPFSWGQTTESSKPAFMKQLKSTLTDLSSQAPPQRWL